MSWCTGFLSVVANNYHVHCSTISLIWKRESANNTYSRAVEGQCAGHNTNFNVVNAAWKSVPYRNETTLRNGAAVFGVANFTDYPQQALRVFFRALLYICIFLIN